MRQFAWLSSLRAKLILSTVLVEALTLGLIVWNSQQVAEEHLRRQFEQRRHEAVVLLQAALTAPMAQHDLAGVSEVMEAVQSGQGYEYLAMLDPQGEVVAITGWDRHRPLPTPTPVDGANAALERFDLRVPMQIGSRSFGELQVGLDLGFITAARADMQRQTYLIAALGLLAAVLVLFALGVWLTRRFNRLTRAVIQLAAGQTYQRLPETARDDIGVLTRAFNDMAASLAARIADLQRAEGEQRQLVRTVDSERARLQALLAAMRQGLLLTTAQQQVAYVNPAFLHCFNLTAEQLRPGTSLESLLQHLAEAAEKRLDPAVARQLFAADGLSREFRLDDGRQLVRSHVRVPLGGREENQLWLIEDITRERQTAEQLRFMAERDALTGLYNRAQLEAELHRRLPVGGGPAGDGDRCALLYFDLDEFKVINDTCGPRMGDQVLQEVGQAVGQLLPAESMLARMGGDEFAILLPGVAQSEVELLAERVLQAIGGLVFEYGGHTLRLTSSLGIAQFPSDSDSPEALVSHADIAMYHAKRSGKNNWQLFRPDFNQSEHMLEQLSWSRRLQTALDRDLFVPFYQGIYGTQDGRLSHVELLLRLLDPEQPQQLLMPSVFIPVAEQLGIIIDIDRWVLRAGIRCLKDEPTLPAMAINLSGRSFDDPTLPGYIARLLDEAGVEPRRLLIELTETAALSNVGDAQRFIAELRRMGCSVCLDDFGVGFSSFAYLKHLEADVIKIDGMFIRHLLTSHEDQVFVRAILEVARGLGKHTVAEFVEDAATLARLAELGVDYAQGYHLSRPAPELPSLSFPPRLPMPPA